MSVGTLRPVAKRPTEGTQTTPPPVIGLEEIAAMLGMTKASVMTRRGRDQITRRERGDAPYLFPVQDWVISGNPVWKPATIRKWARATGRLTAEGPVSLRSGPRRK